MPDDQAATTEPETSSSSEAQFPDVVQSSLRDVGAEDSPEAASDDHEDTRTLLPRSPPLSPEDRSNLVLAVFFFLGLSTLLPWNLFISLNGFWDYKFRDVNGTELQGFGRPILDEDKTDLQKKFPSLLAIASNVPSAVFVILNAAYGQKFGLRKRTAVSLSGVIALFSVVTLLAKVDTDGWQEGFLVVVLTIVILINMNNAVFQGGVFGMGGKFPLKYMGSIMTGQAVGGIFPAVMGIVVVSLTDADEQTVGFSCCLVVLTILLVVLASFAWVSRTSFFLHFAYGHDDDGRSRTPTHTSHSCGALQLLGRAWHYCLAIYATMTVTLSVFPALTVMVESQWEGTTWADKYFQLVCNFLLFNVGDCAGRSLASLFKAPGRSLFERRVTLAASFARVAFVPLFLCCNVSSAKRAFFPSDWDFAFVMSLFSLSNGYISNICMLHGPKMEGDGSLQEEIAMLLVACLVLGTGSGSALSYLVLKLV